MLKHGAIGVVVGAIIGLAIGGIGIGALIGAIASVGIHLWTSRRSVALLLLAVGAVDSAAAQSSPQAESDLPVFFEVRGEGPAVLLVHGGMMDRRMWDPQWAGLGDDVRLIRFDVRGAAVPTLRGLLSGGRYAGHPR